MLNSLISRGPAGGDLPREGWESLESRPPPFARPTLPSSLQPPSFVILSARFVNSEIYSKRDRNVYGRGDRFVSSSLPPLSPRGAWILGSTLPLPREFKIPVTGLHRRREEEEEEEGGRNIPPFRVEDLNILRCCSPTRPIRRRFSFAEEKEGGARRKTKARKETKGKEGRKEERRTTRRVSLMERNWNHLPCDRHGTSSPPELGSRPARRPPVFSPHLFSPPLRCNWNSRKEWKRKEEEVEEGKEKRRKKKRGKGGASVLEAGTGGKREAFETDSATNGVLVKRWSEVQPSLHLSPWVCGPPQMSEGPPPSKHKAVKRFNSIRTAQREEEGWIQRI